MSVADLISSFSRGLLKKTTHGRSDRAGFGAGRGGDLDGDALPRFFRLVFGVASLFCTRWGKRSLRICSRNSSTICQQNNRETTETPKAHTFCSLHHFLIKIQLLVTMALSSRMPQREKSKCFCRPSLESVFQSLSPKKLEADQLGLLLKPF